MKRRLAISALSLAILAALSTPASAETGGCRTLESYCDLGSQCCSHICTTQTWGHALCTAN